MNITNLEITQATIELSLAFAFIITAIILLIYTKKKKSMKLFITMFFVISIILSFEALAYISRGNVDSFNVILNRTSNFIVFFFNYFLTVIFVRYMYSIFNDNNIYPSIICKRIIDLAFLSTIIILTVNIFSGWMYTFDEMNYYKRNYMWYVYTSFSVLLPVVATVLCSKYKEDIPKVNYWTILLYVWLPIFFLLLQTIIYGYSILTIGIAIDLFIMFSIYLFNLRKTKIDDDEIANVRLKRVQSIVLFTFISSFIGAAIISCFVSINKMVKESNEKNSIIIANSISEDINNEVQKLIIVSEAMSKASVLKESLINSSRDNQIVENDLKNYLSSIRDGFGYQMVYAVSNNSKIYYNYNGISRYIDENDYGEDIWYKEFYDSNKNIEVNIDTDKDNNYVLSLFVNVKVMDDDNIIGVCGLGIEINQIASIIDNFEKKYDCTIALTDKDGLIQLASNINLIEKEHLETAYFEEVESEDFHFINKGNGCKITKYLSNLDLFIVIGFNNIDNYALFVLIIPSLIIFIISIFILSVFFLINYIDERRAFETILDKKRAAITDEMTGLLNRSAYENDLDCFSSMDIYDYKIVQFDINCLKIVNDTIGHKAGDELIIGTAHCIINVFKKYGKCYRIGGDEFIAIIKCPNQILEEELKTFEHLTNNYNGTYVKDISVSIGVVYCAEHPNMTIEDMISLADELMYENKNKYYNITGKKRRE